MENIKNCKKIIYFLVMLQPQTILQYFYKLLLWSTSYRFSFGPTDNITFLFTNNHSPYQQFIKMFVFLAFSIIFSFSHKKILKIFSKPIS